MKGESEGISFCINFQSRETPPYWIFCRFMVRQRRAKPLTKGY